MREHAAKTLGAIGDERAVEPLITALKDKNGFVIIAAAGALGEIKDTRAVEPLITALKDKNEFVVRAAAEALVEIKDTRAVEPLIEALKSVNGSVRASAAEALGLLGDMRTVTPLRAMLQEKKEKKVAHYREEYHLSQKYDDDRSWTERVFDHNEIVDEYAHARRAAEIALTKLGFG